MEERAKERAEEADAAEEEVAQETAEEEAADEVAIVYEPAVAAHAAATEALPSTIVPAATTMSAVSAAQGSPLEAFRPPPQQQQLQVHTVTMAPASEVAAEPASEVAAAPASDVAHAHMQMEVQSGHAADDSAGMVVRGAETVALAGETGRVAAVAVEEVVASEEPTSTSATPYANLMRSQSATSTPSYPAALSVTDSELKIGEWLDEHVCLGFGEMYGEIFVDEGYDDLSFFYEKDDMVSFPCGPLCACVLA